MNHSRFADNARFYLNKDDFRSLSGTVKGATAENIIVIEHCFQRSRIVPRGRERQNGDKNLLVYQVGSFSEQAMVDRV